MATFSYTNSTGGLIESGTKNDQTVNVFGALGAVTNVSITITGLVHSWADDVTMLLVHPDTTHNLYFWGEAGSSDDLNGDYTIADGAPALPDFSGQGITTPGTFGPAAYEFLRGDAFFGSSTGGIVHAPDRGSGSFATSFGGLAPGGDWHLYVTDPFGSDNGSLAGWTLSVETDSPDALVLGTAGVDTITVSPSAPAAPETDGGGDPSLLVSETVAPNPPGQSQGTFTLNGVTATYSGVTGPILVNGGPDGDTLSGGSVAILDYSNSNGPVTVNLQTGLATGGHATGDIISGFKKVIGSSFNDILTVNASAGSIDGGPGHDTADYSTLSNGGSPVYFDLSIGYVGTAGFNNPPIFEFHSIESYLGVISDNFVRGTQGDNTISGQGGVDDLRGLGGNDTLIGGGNNDILNGGTGADHMLGGPGNDTYFVDDIGDVVDESVVGSDGFDTVRSEIGVNLLGAGYRGDIEAVLLLGSNNINALGNNLDNTLTGNSGNNTLNGRLGADTMRGVGGNDTYVVNDPGDFVTEALPGSDGFDRVLSTVSFNLSNGAQAAGAIERLDLAGNKNINAIGNALANTIFGNSGNNIINGLEGKDILTGNGGIDKFTFSSILNGDFDTITDMVPGTDMILLDDAVFTILTPGALAAGNFLNTSSGPADADDYIQYNPANGRIFYDADGSGAGAGVLFAVVTPGLALTSADFTVI